MPSPIRRRALRVPFFLIAIPAVLSAGCVSTDQAHSREDASAIADAAGAGVASAIATAVYAPAKIAYAATGAVVGGGAYVVSGGNADLANAVLGPAVTGHYIVTPERLRTPGSLQFRGSGFEMVRRDSGGTPHDALPDVAAPAPPGALPDVAALTPSACTGLGDSPKIYFESGATALDETATAHLAQTTATLLECPDTTAEIRAYSDALGSRTANFALSERRAQTVREYLVTRGVDEHRLRVVNFGEDHPVAANATREGRAANRRVEVVVQ